MAPWSPRLPGGLSARPRLWSGGTLLATLVLAVAGVPPAAEASDQGASWQYAPAQAPGAPPGAQPSQFPAPLGSVGDIEFWAPNRGLLITAGNALVPEGLYAYDGASWHQLSTVCGGTHGRIAWAGPDEFWTISDQRPGQNLTDGSSAFLYWDVSLCHFVDGQVVGSYAMPIGEPESYRPMDAAACAGPSDCWFGGELGEGSVRGAFHLYWDGSSLSVVYSPQDHAVASMAVDQDQIYESVRLAPTDSYGSESTANPPLLHTIAASDPSNPFHNLFPADTQDLECGAFCPPLPEYGTDGSGREVAPDTLAGLALSSDWSPAGDGPGSPQLWAVAGSGFTTPLVGEGAAHPIVLRHSGEAWTQVVPELTNFEPGEDPSGVAADPGEQAAWITIESGDGEAHVDLLSSPDGGQTWAISERDQLGFVQGVGPRGEAGPIACPAAHDCWLATTEGWLFHLTDGSVLPQDTDPTFNGTNAPITYRPPDNGVPEVLPDQAPEDDSLADEEPPAVVTSGGATGPGPTVAGAPKKSKALVQGLHSRVVHKDVLELTFTLTGSAHVQLLASRHGRVVAKTRRQTLRKGKHTLELRLNRRKWPTKLDLKTTAAG